MEPIELPPNVRLVGTQVSIRTNNKSDLQEMFDSLQIDHRLVYLRYENRKTGERREKGVSNRRSNTIFSNSLFAEVVLPSHEKAFTIRIFRHGTVQLSGVNITNDHLETMQNIFGWSKPTQISTYVNLSLKIKSLPDDVKSQLRNRNESKYPRHNGPFVIRCEHLGEKTGVYIAKRLIYWRSTPVGLMWPSWNKLKEIVDLEEYSLPWDYVEEEPKEFDYSQVVVTI